MRKQAHGVATSKRQNRNLNLGWLWILVINDFAIVHLNVESIVSGIYSYLTSRKANDDYDSEKEKYSEAILYKSLLPYFLIWHSL